MPSENTEKTGLRPQDIQDDQYVKIGITDHDGVLRGKYISGKKFQSALKSEAGFCDVVLGWDRNDQTINGLDLTGWHTGFPDAPIKLLPETLRILPHENNVPFCLASFSGKYIPFCPRSILSSVCDKAESMGFSVLAGMEFEFSVFKETPTSVREKNYQDLTPMAPGSHSYSLLRTSVGYDFYHQIIDTATRMGIPVEGIHEETGAGFLEAAITASSPLETTDRAILFKHLVKTLAQQNELLATFMAKWTNAEQGQSGHIHISLNNRDGKNVFFDSGSEHNVSETMRHFIGGQQQLLPDLLPLMAPTVNSFKRLCPGFWAPTWGSWGIDNRTVALRAIVGSSKSQRIEHRVPGADCNPYLAMAAVIASGLWGIEHKIEPTDASSGNAYDVVCPPELKLPARLSAAADRFEQSAAARDFFDDAFIRHYAHTRRTEEERFMQAITNWELSRYLESS